MKKSLGERLRERRGTRSQAEMANVFGVSQSAYSAWERGAKEPSLSTIGSICREFNVSADWLLGLPGASASAVPSVPSVTSVPPDAASAPSEAYWRGLAASQQETIAGLTRLLAASKAAAPVRCGGRGGAKTA